MQAPCSRGSHALSMRGRFALRQLLIDRKPERKKTACVNFDLNCPQIEKKTARIQQYTILTFYYTSWFIVINQQ